MSKPDYQAMSRQELKQYVLTHRDDLEAIRELFDRPAPNAIWFAADTPIEEADRIIRDRFNFPKSSEE